MYRGLVGVVVGVLLVGCGSEGGSEPCTVVDNGGTATISCPDGSSATISDGEDGATGTAGTTGANGTSNRIVATHFCQGPLPGTSLNAQYWAGITATGDVLVRADVYGTAVEVGASLFYAATQNGAATAEVTFTYDASGTVNGGWWRIGLNRSTLVQVVEYHDPDVTNGLLVWTKNPSECITNTY